MSHRPWGPVLLAALRPASNSSLLVCYAMIAAGSGANACKDPRCC